MKFRNKLVISFCIILFVPLVLATGVLFSFQKIQMKVIEQTYDVQDDDYGYLSNSVQLLNRFTKEIYQELKETAEDEPQKFADENYLEQMNTRLEGKASYLIVRKGGTLSYIGENASTALLTQLPDFGTAEDNANAGMYMDVGANVGEQVLVKQIDFIFEDGSEGSAFIVTSMEEVVPEIKDLATDAIVSIVIILIFTACMLSAWIHTSLM